MGVRMLVKYLILRYASKNRYYTHIDLNSVFNLRGFCLTDLIFVDSGRFLYRVLLNTFIDRFVCSSIYNAHLKC